jgi:hypothetical protein
MVNEWFIGHGFTELPQNALRSSSALLGGASTTLLAMMPNFS